MKKLLIIIIVFSVLSALVSIFIAGTKPLKECKNPSAADYRLDLLIPKEIVPNKNFSSLADSYEIFGLDDPWRKVGVNGITDTIKESYNQSGGLNSGKDSINDGIANVYLNKNISSFSFNGVAKILCDIDLENGWGTTDNHKFVTLVNGKDFSADEKVVFKYEGKENEIYVIEQSVDNKFKIRREVRVEWLNEYQFNKLKREKTVEFSENKESPSKELGGQL